MSLIGFFRKLPSLKSLKLKRYLFDFSLKRLVVGVDNIHIDVNISPQVHNTAKAAAYSLMIRHSRSESFFRDHQKERWENIKGTLKQVCRDVLLDGINRAKAVSEVQIDFLGQVSLAKLFLEEIENQYQKLIEHFVNLIRTYELSHKHDRFECFRIKEKLAEIKQNRNRILGLAGKDLVYILAEVHINRLKNIRDLNFLTEQILPDHFFVNPLIFAYPAEDGFFLIQEYALFSHRAEDPDNHNSLKRIVYDILRMSDLAEGNPKNAEQLNGNGLGELTQEAISSTEDKVFDPWIMETENFDRMLNCFDSRELYQKARIRKGANKTVGELKSRIKSQEKLLNLFYREFKRLKMIELVAAANEMKPIYAKYCPPLSPRQVREFIVKRGSRKQIVRQLKRLRSFYDKSFSLSPLYEAIGRVKRCSSAQKKRHLLVYLKHFSRYHRDLNNYRLLKEAMDAVNILRKEKILMLSRENRSLYEFLLPDERTKEDKPIINHVIVKADIRGSTDITYLMRSRGLNPASYFSLNFYDPISEILSDYSASKVFIEGDAFILSIIENKDSPSGWYSVARACGLASRMLDIVKHYNLKNQEHNLPVLELGIGICHDHKPPAFLFDGDSSIMISPAINLADRLSGCDKRLRRGFRGKNPLFNLYVFQNVKYENIEDTKEDFFLRYNVNGIELNAEGFVKLSGEIKLKSVLYPIGNHGETKLYTGKFPTLADKYEHLVVREATILEVNPDTMDVIGKTSRKYYEVCTHPNIFEFVKNHT